VACLQSALRRHCLDIMLPKLNGYQVCIEIRKRGIWAPVLMLTAKDGDLDEAEALDSGADDFVRKPFSFVVLLARLRALARRGTLPRPASLKLGDLKLDPGERRVYVGTAELMLTPTEFAVLEVPMRHPGQVVTKRPFSIRAGIGRSRVIPISSRFTFTTCVASSRTAA
jgi:two-component system OmpR family response regulator